MENNYQSIALDAYYRKELYENSYLSLVTIGADVGTDNSFSSNAPLREYLFTLILSGEGTYCFESKNHKKSFKSGTFIVLKPGEYFNLYPQGEIKRLWFHASGTAIPEIISQIRFDEEYHSVQLPFERCAKMTDIFNELYTTAKHYPHHLLKLNALIHSFIGCAVDVSTKDWISESFKNSVDYIDKNFRQNIQIHTIADIAHLNHHYYIKQFKAYYKTTPYQYIMQKRFNAAIYDLMNTDFTIDEIGIRNGFNNRIHFSQMFKKHFKITPIEFRKRYR